MGPSGVTTVQCSYCGEPGEAPLRRYEVRIGATVQPRQAVDSPPGWGRRARGAQLLEVCPSCAQKLQDGALRP